MVNNSATLVKSKVPHTLTQEDPEPAHKQQKAERLTPRAMRFLGTLVEYGGAFNEMSLKQQIVLVRVSDKKELYKAREELVQSEYITTGEYGKKKLVYLTRKPLPDDLPYIVLKRLKERCARVDCMNASGDHRDRYSPFQARRREQVPLVLEALKLYFPYIPPTSE